MPTPQAIAVQGIGFGALPVATEGLRGSIRVPIGLEPGAWAQVVMMSERAQVEQLTEWAATRIENARPEATVDNPVAEAELLSHVPSVELVED